MYREQAKKCGDSDPVSVKPHYDGQLRIRLEETEIELKRARRSLKRVLKLMRAAMGIRPIGLSLEDQDAMGKALQGDLSKAESRYVFAWTMYEMASKRLAEAEASK